MSEHDAQKAIREWLAYRRIFHWRNNTGAMVSEYKGKQSDAQKEFQVRFEVAGGFYILARSIDEVEREFTESASAPLS